jgi:hypothetical protein
MIIMTKFQKRLQKLVNHADTVLVVGSGLGEILALTEIFNTVFIIAPEPPSLKLKNIVYRENFNELNQLENINVIVIDLDHVCFLDKLVSTILRWRPVILIEGNRVIERKLSAALYRQNYRATDQQGFYHVWTYQK